MKCTRCQTITTGDALFCRNCGSPVRPNDIIECDNHSGTDAGGLCVVCGKPVCNDCSVSREDKIYCDEAAHLDVPVAYVKLASVVTQFDADLIAKNLSANGIPTLVFFQHRYSHFCRLTDDASTSIFVERTMADAAHHLVKKMDLTDFLRQNNIHS